MYESMKKAAAVAAPTMAALPAIAPIVSDWRGRNRDLGEKPVYPDGPRENPAEKFRAELDKARADLSELETMIARAKSLCDLAERAPYQGGNWSAQPTPEQQREIRHARKALEEFSSLLPATFKTWIDRLEKFNVQLRGNLQP